MPKPSAATLATLVVLLLSAFPSRSLAQQSQSQGAAVCTFANAQEFPVLVSDGSGGAIIAWRDRRASGLFNTFAQHISADGTADPGWPVGGRSLGFGLGDQINTVIASDGAGGAVVAWQDARVPNYAIFAQHVLSNGSVDPGWPGGGLQVCPVPGGQFFPGIVADGLGGVIISWEDRRANPVAAFAQHVFGSGVVDPAWPAGGLRVCGVASSQLQPTISGDGAGGAIIAWEDWRSGGGDIYAQHVKVNGSLDPAWPASALVVCAAAGIQSATRVVSDGAGGALLTWQDLRSGPEDIYANHVLAGGTTDPVWPANGLAICNAPGQQLAPLLAGDGSGGAFIAWRDVSDAGSMNVQHALSTGVVDPAWPANGRPVAPSNGTQYEPALSSDGTGGAFASWVDTRNGGNDLFAQHVLTNGGNAPGWPSEGLTVCDAAAEQRAPSVIPDGSGGAIVAWMDNRVDGTETTFDIYAQRIAGNGHFVFADAEIPRIVSVRDIPGDQGGKVKLSWTASGPDKVGAGIVSEYWVWRSVPPNETNALTASASLAVLEGAARPTPGAVYISRQPSLAGYFWELFGTQRAGGLDGYSLVCRTETDSLPTGNPYTVFFVQARNTAGTFVRSSDPDSGYSVDNLAPPAPAPFAVKYGPGTNMLHWTARSVADLQGYRVHRGSSDHFIPSEANLLATTAETSFVDIPGPFYYKLAAMDIHTNRSRYLTASPDRPVAALASFVSSDRMAGRVKLTWFSAGNSGMVANVYRRTETTGWSRLGQITTDGAGYLTFDDATVEDGQRYAYRLGIVEPGDLETLLEEDWVEPLAVAFTLTGHITNPSTGGRVTLTLSLPSGASAEIRLVDVSGRLVESRHVDANGGGERAVEFGGGQHLRPGVYLVNGRSGGAQFSRRVVVLD